MAERAEALLDSRLEAVKAVRRAAGLQGSVLRIGHLHSLSVHVLPELLRQLKQDSGDIQVLLRTGSTDDLLGALLAGQLDALVISPLPGLPDVVTVPMFTESVVAAVPSAHPLAQRAQIALQQLRHESFSTLTRGYGLRALLYEACGRAGFQPKIGHEVENVFLLTGLVGAGLCVTILPACMCVNSQVGVTYRPLLESLPTTRTVGLAFLNASKERLELRNLARLAADWG